MTLELLPIDPHLGEIADALRTTRAVVVTAAPGAGKTTRVPPALVGDGPVLLLQPRRVAARAIARRIAEERGWALGREVGWHVRFDHRASPETRLLVATEGVLTARLQQDPLLNDFRTVIVDEFHERSIHADLGLALARQAWLARPDLRIVVMSATLDAERVASFLGGCRIVRVPGRLHPVDIAYRPGVTVDQAVANALPASGALLCFLPGAAEIRRTAAALAERLGRKGTQILPLHGGLDADAQDAAVRPGAGSRVILATNLAETTLTVPDVRVVVDGGLHKVARYDADRAIDSLEVERISQDAADQRAGRAGRLAAGTAIRLWDQRDRLRPHREAEISRIDVSSVLLDILGWGGNPREFEWFEAPPEGAVERGLELLGRLGAVDAAGALTAAGRDLHRLPLHPRLGRLLLTAGGTARAAFACALLSERHYAPTPVGTTRRGTSCDLLSATDDLRRLPAHIAQVARDLEKAAARALGSRARSAGHDEDAFRRAVLSAYPDRVGRRRARGSDRVVLSSGSGAKLGRESGVFDAEFLVAVDVAGGTARSGTANEVVVRMATGIEKDWLPVTSSGVEHSFDAASGTVKAVRTDYYEAMAIRQTPIAAEADARATLLAEALLRRGPSEADRQLLRRLAFAGAGVTFTDLVHAAAGTFTQIDDADLAAHLPRAIRQTLDKDAPAQWTSPKGRRARIDYRDDGRVVVAIRLQDVFGLEKTPTIGSRRVPLTFELLAPNGRPVQVTADLESFWKNGYPIVRKELRARYPKHQW